MTVCLSSLLSFAATKNELHDFSPAKEPLLSMLEGEIQAMYMCKPGERQHPSYCSLVIMLAKIFLFSIIIDAFSFCCCYNAAIERAMAYLDTGELPWGMDLFDDQAEKQVECQLSHVLWHVYRRYIHV